MIVLTRLSRGSKLNLIFLLNTYINVCLCVYYCTHTAFWFLTCCILLPFYLDAEDDQTGQDLDEKTCHSYEFNGSMVDSPGQDKRLLSLEHYMHNVCDIVQIAGNEEDHIKMLENTLEEGKAAYAALYLELEKERAAAAAAGEGINGNGNEAIPEDDRRKSCLR